MAKEKKDKGAYTTIWGVCPFLKNRLCIFGFVHGQSYFVF